MTWVYVLASIVAMHFLYWFVIVPFHKWAARKLGCQYDPYKNEFIDTNRGAQ